MSTTPGETGGQTILDLLKSCGLDKQKNKDKKLYSEVFEEEGIEYVHNLEEFDDDAEISELINFKGFHFKKFIKARDLAIGKPKTKTTTNGHKSNTRSSQSNGTKLDEEIEDDEKYNIVSQQENKYPERKDWKGEIQVKYETETPNSGTSVNGRPQKIILVVGQTGVGKTTVLNSMINYLFDVKFDNKYRFKLIVEKQLKQRENNLQSVTDDVTSYFLRPCNPEVNYDLTVVDSPGFGDTRGLEWDKKIVKKIKYFFENKLDTITGVCFVIKASETRLGPAQKYIFSQLFSVFGKDIAKNIFVLITFSDGGKPNALKALQAEDVKCPYQSYFKLNNSAFFNEERDRMTKMFWDMGIDAFKDFFREIGTTKDQSLKMTKQVLKQREALVVHVEDLHKQISEGTGKIEALAFLEDQLETYANQIDQCKDFEIKSKVPKTNLIPVGNGNYTTYCADHHQTCHKVCGIPNDNDKAGCAAMTNGYCHVCVPNGTCHWSNHHNYQYILEPTFEIQTVRKQELLDKYGAASEGASQAEHFIEKIEEELVDIKLKVLDLIKEVTICNEALKKTALRHNPISQKEYIKLMIEAERRDRKDGYIGRIKSLEQLAKSLDLINGITTGKYDKDMESITLFKSNKSSRDSKYKSSIQRSKLVIKQKADSSLIQKAKQTAVDLKNKITSTFNISF